ncbi:MAG: hypothetical protein ACRET5_06440 [Steroidobacteraceae bacterium]
MTLLPQVRRQLDSAAQRHATRPGQARTARVKRQLLPRRFPTLAGVIPAVAVIVALGIGAGAIALLSHRHTPATPPVSRPATHASKAVKRIETLAASQFAVFARPQTAKDRSLPALARRAIRLGGLGTGFQSALNGVIPSLTRYTQTLPDGREVFLTVYNPQDAVPPGARHHPLPATTLIVGPVIVQPDGKWTNGQPLSNPRGGESARAAFIIARTGNGACGLDTYTVIAPNQVARIRWQFGRQDRAGYVFNAPLTVNMTAHGNIAVATIPQRTSCDRPAAVTLYGHDGQVLSHTGNTSNLNRITRSVNHGNPFAYKRLFHRPQRATGTP